MSLSSAASGQSNDCGSCTVLEGEPCIVDGGDDVTNGGCNTTPDPQWTDVTCGVTICGISSTYQTNFGGPCDTDEDCVDQTCVGDPNPGDGNPEGTCTDERRDTDWYRISKDDLDTASGGTGVLTLTATLTSEFEGSVFIVDIADCANVVILDVATTSLACDLPGDCPSNDCVGDTDPGDGIADGTCTGCTPVATVDALIYTGDYLSGLAVVVVPSAFGTGVDCNVNDGYLLDITCEGHPAECNGLAENRCDVAVPPGSGIKGCKDPECCVVICALLPQCCLIEWDLVCAAAAPDRCVFLPEPCPPLDETTCQLPQLLGSGGLPNTWFIGQTSDLAQNIRVADNFVAGETGAIGQVCWWGFYDDGSAIPDCGATAADAFTVTFYADDGNALPGAEIASFNTLSVTRTEDGVHVVEDAAGDPIPELDRIIYRYSAELPDTPVVGVDIDQCYWLEITNNLDGTCAWIWETAWNDAPTFGDDYSLADDLTGYDYTDATDIEMGWCVDITLGDITTCSPANPQESCDPAGSIILTQNSNPSTFGAASVRCQAGDAFTTENFFARSYNLADPDYGVVGQDIEVVCVPVAVWFNAGGAYPTEINIYEDTNGGDPTHPDVDLNLLGSTIAWIPVNTDDGFVEARFDPPVSVPADTLMVVELFAPERDPSPECDVDADCPLGPCNGDPNPGDGVAEGLCDTWGDGGGFAIGANNLGSTVPGADSYLRSPSCGLVNYGTVTSIGFPESQWMQEVHVNVASACPCDCADGGDGVVNVLDFLALIGEWGGPGACDCADGGDGIVNVLDFLAIIADWGPC
jgi:hypothetical protein